MCSEDFQSSIDWHPPGVFVEDSARDDVKQFENHASRHCEGLPTIQGRPLKRFLATQGQ